MEELLREDIKIVFKNKEREALSNGLKKQIKFFKSPSSIGYKQKFPYREQFFSEILEKLSTGNPELMLHVRHCSSIIGYCNDAAQIIGNEIFLEIKSKLQKAQDAYLDVHEIDQ